MGALNVGHVFDSNILIYHINGQLDSATEQIMYGYSEQPAYISIIIRRNYRLKLPDAVIAATALHLGLPLITRNVKDFKDIPELKLLNPFK